MRLPPLITWSDVRWILFVVAGLGFLYGVIAVIFLSATLPDPWARSSSRSRSPPSSLS
jgi:hypothetical protein